MLRAALGIVFVFAITATANAHEAWECSSRGGHSKLVGTNQYIVTPKGLFVYSPPFSGPIYQILVNNRSGIVATMASATDDRTGVEIIAINTHTGEFLHTWSGISNSTKPVWSAQGKCRAVQVKWN
jgi:hypothetical protein